MRVTDLLAEHSLQLTLETPTSMHRLRRKISRCAPTEQLDPTPFLDKNVLLLVTGMGMNFSEQSIWDGYVERLTRVPISAICFAVGIAHRVLPPQLVAACTKHDIPLLAVPSDTPLLKIDQHVENVLQAERVELVSQGWRIADECTRLVSEGADVSLILTKIHDALDAPVSVYDAFGWVISQHPVGVHWQTGPKSFDAPDVMFLPLPMGLHRPCKLAVKRLRTEEELNVLLAPVTSVLALQLNRSRVIEANTQLDMLRFVNRCLSWSEATRTDVIHAFNELGLSRKAQTALAVAEIRGDNASSVWKLRLTLHECFHDVRIAEQEDRLIALLQFPRKDYQYALDQLLNVQDDLPLIYTGPKNTIDELRISLVHAFDLIKHCNKPTAAPEMGLAAVVAAAAGRGARTSAHTFLAPLTQHDAEHNTELLRTLIVYLQNDAQPTRACKELFIHRNSLSYRLHRIEELLGISLDSLDGRATCLIAIRLAGITPS